MFRSALPGSEHLDIENDVAVLPAEELTVSCWESSDFNV